MSKTIDQRVVEMRFDNQQFESGVNTSLNTLDRLKNGLNLSDSAKGLEVIGQAADSVKLKFSALQVMGVTALTNITNAIMNTGKKLASAITIEPITDGFREYELQIDSTQTIMANTGRSVKDVNKALDELNEYADLTIYNFAEMTKNAGMFTSAGLGLEDTMTALKGVGNWAAYAGANSQQMSNATYQLGQALNAGAIRLQDWMSIEKSAGMGGKLYRDAFIETARAMGTGVDAAMEKYGSFRDSLREGWLTTEVFLETMKKFADNKSMTDAATKVKTFTQMISTLKEALGTGWASSFRIIVGDFEEAKSLFTDITSVLSNIIGKAADARNEVLKGWAEFGGRTKLIEALKNAFNTIASVVVPIKEALNDIFPPMTAARLYVLTAKLADFIKNLQLSTEQMDNLKRTFKGAFAVLNIVKQGLVAIWTAISPLISKLGELANYILGVTASWGDWLVGADKSLKKTNVMQKALTKFSNYIKTGFAKVKDVINDVGASIAILIDKAKAKFNFPGLEALSNLFNKFKVRSEQVTSTFSGAKESISSFIKDTGDALADSTIVKLLGKMWEALKTVGSGIIDILAKLGNAFVESISEDGFNAVFDVINGFLSSGLLGGIAIFIGKINKLFKTSDKTIQSFSKTFENIGKNGLQFKFDFKIISQTLDSVKGCFEAWQSTLKADVLKKIAVAIAILAGSLLVLSMVDSVKLTIALGAITGLFSELLGAMAIFNKINGVMPDNVKEMNPALTSMIAMSASILLLSSALVKIADLDWEGLAKGITGVGALAGVLLAFVKVVSDQESVVLKGAGSLIIFGVAIKVLASVCKDLSTLKWDDLAKGLLGVGTLIAAVGVFLTNTKFQGKSISTALGILVLSAAIKVLASACKDFQGMTFDGLAGVSLILAGLAIFVNSTGKAEKVLSTGVALIAVAAAMKVFASAVNDFGSMSPEVLSRGLLSLAVALAAVTAALNFMPADMISTSVGLIGVGAALMIIAKAISTIGALSIEQAATGFVTLGLAIAGLAVALTFMSGTLAGSAALMVAAVALAVIAPTLVMLAAIPFPALMGGLIGIAAAIAVLGVAAALLGPYVLPLIAIAGALALVGSAVMMVGASAALAGVGVLAICTGILGLSVAFGLLVTVFKQLAEMGKEGAKVAAEALAVIADSVITLIPTIAEKIAEGIITVCRIISDSYSEICAAFTIMFAAFINSIKQSMPLVLEVVNMLIQGVLDILVESSPKVMTIINTWVQGVLDLLTQAIPKVINIVFLTVTSLLEALAEYGPRIITAVVDILFGCITALLSAIAENIPKLIQAGVDILSAFIIGIGRTVPQLVDAGFQAMIDFLNGLAESIRKNTPLVVQAVDNLFDAIIEAGVYILTHSKTRFKTAATNIISNFIQGIKDKISAVVRTFKKMITDALDGIGEKAEDFVTSGKQVVNGFIKGIKSKIKDVKDAVSEFGNESLDKLKEVLGIHSPSKEAEYAGDMVGEGFTKGINNSTSDAKKASTNLGTTTINSLSDAISAGKTDSDGFDFFGLFLGDKDDLTSGMDEITESVEKTATSVSTVQEEVIEEEKSYWSELLKIQKSGVEASKYENMKVVDFKEDILKQTEELNKQYIDAINSERDNLMGQYSLFADVEEKEKVDSKTLLYNLKHQVDEYEDYKNIIAGLNRRIDNDMLLEEINKMGISQLEELKALYKMSDSQLDEYVKLFETKYSKCQDIAYRKSKNIRLETEDQLSKLYGGLDVNVDEFFLGGLFDGTFESIDQYVSAVITKMLLGGEEIEAGANELAKKVATSALNNSVNTDLYSDSPTATGSALTTGLADGISDDVALSKVNASSEEVTNSAIKTIRGFRPKFEQSGKYLVEGFAQAIDDNAQKAIDAVVRLGASAVEALRAALDEHSPSKVTYQIGDYAGIGFVNALLDNISSATIAGRDMGNAAINGLAKTLMNIDSIISDDINTQPTIRPVLDLSNVEAGTSRLNSLFSRNQAMSISSSLNRVDDAENQNGSKSTTGNIYQFTQNNYSPKALPRTEIYRQTKSQFAAMERMVEGT